MSNTKKIRIKVTVSNEDARLIKSLAEREGLSVSAKTSQLFAMGMELIEDFGLSMIAEKRMAAHDGTYISHEEAWK